MVNNLQDPALAGTPRGPRYCARLVRCGAALIIVRIRQGLMPTGTLALAIAIPLLTGALARADGAIPAVGQEPALSSAPSTFKLNPAVIAIDVQNLREQWMQCTAAAAKADLHRSRPAEALADAAFQWCEATEQPLARALKRQLGTVGAKRVLEQVREMDRSNLARAIEKLRAKPE